MSIVGCSFRDFPDCKVKIVSGDSAVDLSKIPSYLGTHSNPSEAVQKEGKFAICDATLHSIMTWCTGYKVLFFFYPLNFTFVCPSEIIALNKMKSEFESRKTKVFLVSVDSHYSHIAYATTSKENGGIGEMGHAMISDINKELSVALGVLHHSGVSLRAAIIIGEDGIIKHQTVNELAIGRNTNELLRVLDAIEHNKQYGEVCPINWKKGEAAMVPNVDGMKKYINTSNS
ncbi:putative peroxiredoxin [Candidatus Fokinia solitaria]|uniref:Putative peroxiredoxin n=1 Tax=Candidatus Fokinia solitaria TaxID=1802984 RepID=A0A2U8BSE4_9RICK|nr:peroxiredoxin [Candidatus Fokinia solitaria]AWD33218.1 putative peroxiredoxin [Candidatus Fokinia solitaria]